MKHIAHIAALILLLTSTGWAQTLPANFNLIPNSSFEFNNNQFHEIDDTDFDSNNYCWVRANKSGVPVASDSSAGDGHDKARTGFFFGYVLSGLPTYHMNTEQFIDTSHSTYRGYAETKILSPLTAGITYYFTLYAGVYKPDSNSIYSASGSFIPIISNIGVYFSDTQLKQYDTNGRINVTPQIRFVDWDISQTDTCVYTKLTAAYTATGGEQYVTIGNFDFIAQYHFIYSNHVDTTIHSDIALGGTSLVAIDDISLVSDTTQPLISLGNFSIGNDTILCPGQSLTIGGQPYFFSYLWSTGDTSRFITIDHPGIYWCTVGYGCSIYTDTITIAWADTSLSLGNDTTICNPALSYTLNVSDTLQNILWSTGSTAPSIIIARPGSYWVQAQGACGLLSDTIQVSFCSPVIDAISKTDTICSGECVTFSAQTHNYPQNYNWTFEGGNPATYEGATPPSVCYANSGTYNVKLVISNAVGRDSLTTNITVLPQPVPVFTDTAVTVPYNTTITLPACAAAMHAQWFHKDSLICDQCNTLTLQAKEYQSIYQCVVSNAGCTDTCNYMVMVSGIPTSDVWLPNAFSPNGDGRNDYFHVITDNPNFVLMELMVFNRWGQKIYDMVTEAPGWDGRYGGKLQDGGTYFWYLRYKISGTDAIYSKKGDVTLVQ